MYIIRCENMFVANSGLSKDRDQAIRFSNRQLAIIYLKNNNTIRNAQIISL